jgi:hypothetical protein
MVPEISPAIDIRARETSADVVAALDHVCAEYGMPGGIRVDNGPEFIRRNFIGWEAGRRGAPAFSASPTSLPDRKNLIQLGPNASMQTTDLGGNLIAFGQSARVFGMNMLQSVATGEYAFEISTRASMALAQMIRLNRF